MSAVGRNSGIASGPQVRLRDIDADFLRFVAEDERQLAGDVALRAIDIEDGPFDPRKLLSSAGDICGVVVTGMVNRQIQLEDHVALRVLGPGHLVPLLEHASSEVMSSSEWSAAGVVRMAVLGTQFMRASARWPQLQRNLIARFTEQNEELGTQLALCQLPRVEDRLLAMLWLLAEAWGRVTPAGTLLPLHFTHEALGAMVGARRPTVTLALGELAQRGAVVQRDRSWLLLESPRQPSADRTRVEAPVLLELTPTEWAHEEEAAERSRREREELLEHVSRLREEHERAVGLLHERLRRAEAARIRAHEIRDQVRAERRLAGRRSP